MTEQHPTVAPPMVANIPPELMDRTQWVCWAFEYRNDNWTKVPYTPHTTKKARSNAPSSWRTLKAALSCYQERPDFFDGIGFMFSKDDPYVGGDIDHCITDGAIGPDALALLPDTYAEISPSGTGIKFIGRAAGEYGRKTTRGELYSKTRFFTITGRVLPGHQDITDCQEQIDAYAAALGTTSKPPRDGTPGSGSRAEKVKLIPEEDWEAGRQLRRTGMNRLLARVRASAVSRKTGTDDTQLGYLLRENYRGFHERWDYAGIVRGDGSLDSSQIRAAMASNISRRGFTFPEYVALMGYFFGAEVAAKTGTKQGVREEFAALWFYGRTPRADEAQPPAPEKVKRGRGSNHAELLERAYATLETFKVGIDAVLTIGDLSEAMNVSRRSAAALLAQLASQDRITKRQHGQYGGLLISFSGMHNDNTNAEPVAHTEHSNGHYPDRDISAAQELDATISGMHNEQEERSASAAPEKEITVLCIPENERGSNRTHIDTYNQYCVTPAPVSCIPEKRVGIADAVSAAFDALPHDRVTAAGELKRWPITDKRIVAYVQAEHADRNWKDDAICYWAGKHRKRRKAAAFDELAQMRREALEKKAGAVRKEIARAETKAATEAMPELREWYAKRAAQLSGQQALLGWELSRRDEVDAARIEASGYSPGEQQEMLDIVEKEYRPKGEPARTPRVLSPSADVGAMLTRLKARQVND